MERIKKALQLASQERAAGAHDVIAFGEPLAAAASADGDVRYTQTRVIDVPPRQLAAARVVTGAAQDAATRAYKLLRTQVLQKLAARDWRTVAVVSPTAGDGKTLTAINLAINIGATPSHTALLVDLDWRQPAVHRYFGYRPEHDVCDYLRGTQPLSAAAVNPGLPRFCFLPCRAPVPDSSEQLGNLGGFVRELKGRYRNRIVLFDLPPLLATDDALSFLPHVDAVLLVVEEGRTRRPDVARSLALLDQNRLLGSVVNKSRQLLPDY